MKKVLSNFLVVVLSSIVIVSCGFQTQPTTFPTITLRPTETLTLTSTIKPTATFLPIFITPDPLPILTPISIFPTDVFTSLTPQGGKIGGINGVFVYDSPSPPDNSFARGYEHLLFRFYDDGLVLSAGFYYYGSLQEDTYIMSVFNRRDWPERGTYYLSGERIWFSIIVNKTKRGDYSGIYLENTLFLSSYDPVNGDKVAELEYIRANVGQ
jgi:hypothetical protein